MGHSQPNEPGIRIRPDAITEQTGRLFWVDLDKTNCVCSHLQKQWAAFF